METVWDIQSKLTGLDKLDPQSRNLQIVEAILANRGIDTVDEFIKPTPVDFQFLTKMQGLFGDDLLKAVATIKTAMAEDQAIIIHGDYDVDGVSATAILWEVLYFAIGYRKVWPFIPHRVDHGYGLSTESIDAIVQDLVGRDQKPGLLITVDCGITAKSSVEYAHDNGFQVVVTDHHTRPQADSDLPAAEAVLHTYQLCGAGISWVLANSLIRLARLNAKLLAGGLQGADLVALATLADVQELVGYNRSLVVAGLAELTKHPRVGLQALYELAGIRGKKIGTYEVGWIIAPRMNATGRLEHALEALRLLVTQDRQQAASLARLLDKVNSQRQEYTTIAVEQALAMVGQEWNGTSPIVVAHPDWHEGVIGLVAGKLTERYRAPALAITKSEGGAKGSARSIDGVNIVELLRRGESLLDNFGGHAAAAGFSLPWEQVGALKELLGAIDLIQEFGLSTNRQIVVDLALCPDWIDWGLYESLAALEPHGMGNPKPVFASYGVSIGELKTVGKEGKHLKFVTDAGLNAIAFGMGDRMAELLEFSQVDLVYNIDQDTYRGGQAMQLKVKAIKLAE